MIKILVLTRSVKKNFHMCFFKDCSCLLLIPTVAEGRMVVHSQGLRRLSLIMYQLIIKVNNVHVPY